MNVSAGFGLENEKRQTSYDVVPFPRSIETAESILHGPHHRSSVDDLTNDNINVV
jgi:hypothetical protein